MPRPAMERWLRKLTQENPMNVTPGAPPGRVAQPPPDLNLLTLPVKRVPHSSRGEAVTKLKSFVICCGLHRAKAQQIAISKEENRVS